MKNHTTIATIWLVVLFLPIISVSFGQENPRKFRIGLEVVPAVSWLNEDVAGYESYSVGGSFQPTLKLDIALNEDCNYYVSTGVGYQLFTGHLKYADIAYPFANDSLDFRQATTEATYDLQYLEIPVYIKMRTNEIGYMRYYGQVGLSTGFNIRARQNRSTDYEGSNGQKLEVKDDDITSSTNLMNLQLNAGLGIEYNLTGHTNIFLGITYQHGLVDLLANKAYEVNKTSGDVEINANGLPKTPNIEAQAWSRIVAINIGVFF